MYFLQIAEAWQSDYHFHRRINALPELHNPHKRLGRLFQDHSSCVLFLPGLTLYRASQCAFSTIFSSHNVCAFLLPLFQSSQNISFPSCLTAAQATGKSLLLQLMLPVLSCLLLISAQHINLVKKYTHQCMQSVKGDRIASTECRRTVWKRCM